MIDFLRAINHLAWVFAVVIAVAVVSWKLCRFLDQATRTSEARARDLERNFHLKNLAENVLREAATLLRDIQVKVERETPPPRL